MMVSIIIPVYNAEKYLRRCVDSVLAQTHQDFEVILIDDGSVDQSYEICCEYANRDSRILAIHQENQGVSAARNAGVCRATGTHIAFVDADDYIMPDYLEVLFCNLQKNQAQIACCDFIEIPSNVPVTPNAPRVRKTRLVQNGEELFSDMIQEKEGYFACVWGKLISTEIARKVSFKNIKFGEDHLYMFDLFALSPIVHLSTYKGYCYAPNEGSVTVRHTVTNVYRNIDELQMHRYKAEKLPPFAQAFHGEFYGKYAAAAVGLIGAVCRTGDAKEGRDIALREAKQILKSHIKIHNGVLLRLVLFCLSPGLYGAMVRRKIRS